MNAFNKKAPWILLLGDISVFIISLWVTLLLRHAVTPDKTSFLAHLTPFSFLFFVWVLVFFISGLYDKQGFVSKSRLPVALIETQIVNILIATAFFYFIPWYGITPKTTLFLYLLVSLALTILWRVYGYFNLIPRSRERAIMIGSGEEIRELAKEIGGHRHYNIDIVSSIDVDQMPAVLIPEKVAAENVSTIAADLNNNKVQGILPSLYNLLFSKIRFISLDSLYEETFDRVPLSILKHNWFLENISTTPKYVYDTLKRLMDIIISLALGMLSLVFYPFVALFIKLEDKGPLFYIQERVGQNEKPVRIIKFRSMSVSKNVDLKKDSESRVTKFGAFLRKSRIDELPQLWNVLKGDLSLIGPRPELPTFVELYEKEIPYYKIRHIIKPGLSGWAQLYHDNHPHHGVAVEQTKEKLAYDLYYVKNRSFLLDLNIALKTIKKLISRQGL